MSGPCRVLWTAFLVVLAAALFVFGAIRPWAVAATAVALGLLYGLSLVLLPEPPKLSRVGALFLAGCAAILVLQAAPLPFLYPHTTRLRATHGVGVFWPGTADAFLSLRFTAQMGSYVLAALLVGRLRQAGLSMSTALRGLLLVAGLEAAWGVIRDLAGITWVPFWEGQDTGGASGTLVNRNSFAGFCAMGLCLAAALAASRFTWPPRRAEEGRPALGRRLESGLGWALLASLFATALVLSKSRGGALAAMAGLALLPFLYRGRASMAGVVALLATGVVVVVAAHPGGILARFEEIDPFEISANMRWRIWTLVAAAGSHQPVLGFGVGTLPNAFHPFQPADFSGQLNFAHNEYVNVFFEVGLVGLTVVLGALGAWLLRSWKGLRTLHSSDRLPAAGVVAGVIALLVHSIVDFDLRITGVGLLWAALIGMGASLSRDGKAVKSPPWLAVGTVLAAALLLAFLPLKSLGWAPYDHTVAWQVARASGDPVKFETAAALFPAHPDIQRESGLAFWGAGDAARAAACLKRLFAQSPGDVETILDQIYDPARPIADYEALLPGTSAAAAHLTAYLALQGDWKTAMDVWERLVRSDEPAPHDYLAAALRQMGQWGLEARVRERRLEARTDAWALGACAEAWLRLDVLDRALERAAGAERIAPADGRWSAMKAEILVAKGDLLAAYEAYTEALTRGPAELEYRLRRGELAARQRTWESAAEDFREVLRSRPDERRAVLGLARALIGLTQKESAKILLDEWLSRHPQDAEAEQLRASHP